MSAPRSQTLCRQKTAQRLVDLYSAIVHIWCQTLPCKFNLEGLTSHKTSVATGARALLMDKKEQGKALSFRGEALPQSVRLTPAMP
jgi:hypothetical protein